MAWDLREMIEPVQIFQRMIRPLIRSSFRDEWPVQSYSDSSKRVQLSTRDVQFKPRLEGRRSLAATVVEWSAARVLYRVSASCRKTAVQTRPRTRVISRTPRRALNPLSTQLPAHEDPHQPPGSSRSRDREKNMLDEKTRLLAIQSLVLSRFDYCDLKHSIIKPLHKAGDINTASNYRPISLQPVISKILEKVISNQLSTHLDKSNLLHPNQYAYRKHTCWMLNITEKIYSDIDTKNVTLLLLLDLSKAFDSVEHTRLLQKISNIGIATQWLHSYLANHSHAVRLENTISSPIQNDFGIPQGSILGPLLFSIFINDFPTMPSNTRISLYADDAQIAMTSAPAKLIQTKSNAEIYFKHAKSWYDQNGLKLNASKTQYIIFGSKNTIKKLPNLTLILGNDIIEPVGKVKNLGVWFDQNMSFPSHVEKTYSKINGTLMFLHRVKNMLNEKTRLLAIQSLVLSRFDYCDLVWGNTPKGLQKELQKCMNFAAKVLCKGNFRKNDHATPLMEKLNWTPIEQRLLIHMVKYVFSSLYRPQSSANVVKFYPPTTKGV
ncbi:Reverse transcriptase domain, partial [Trinorchestia longiramus]